MNSCIRSEDTGHSNTFTHFILAGCRTESQIRSFA